MKKYILMSGLLLMSRWIYALTYNAGDAGSNNQASLTITTLTATTENATTITGTNISATGNISIPTDAAPRTNVTPNRAGNLIFNSTDSQLCMSTGTTASTWAIAATTGTKCGH